MNESSMRIAIERKRDGNALPDSTWESIVSSYMDGAVEDAHMAALLMACVWRGLDLDETAALTRGMVASGATLAFPNDMFVVDKHSSGGVGDIISLVAVPIVAACGVPVAKLSGRALGHTGGTIDKLETIPGMRTALTMQEFVAQVERVGCAIAAQTEAIVPADKRIYRLRDRTATVPSIGLIAGSIVSKKVAGGAAAFVFDVKCGSAAFMRDPELATSLAKTLVAVSKTFDRRARAVVTDMNEPLGRAIGPGLETIEAREFLRGERDPRSLEVCMRIATEMLGLAGVVDARATAELALAQGRAYEKFTEMIAAQGGDVKGFEALQPSAPAGEVAASRSGYISRIDAVALGHIARQMSEDDPCAGILMRVHTGDSVIAGEALAELHGSFHHAVDVRRAIEITDEPPAERKLIYATI